MAAFCYCSKSTVLNSSESTEDPGKISSEIGCSDLVRTAKSNYVPAGEAIAILKEGNACFVAGQPAKPVTQGLRISLAEDGQLPMAAVLGCADSRCPVELMFGAMPGDIFVCRNAGNTIVPGEGSVVASLEYCIGHLQTKLILVLGHTKCGALKGAVATLGAGGASPKKSMLENYLHALTPVADRAKRQLPAGSSDDQVAAHAIKVNVLHTIERIYEESPTLRERIDADDVRLLGAVYDITSGHVELLEEESKMALFERRKFLEKNVISIVHR